MRWLRLVLLCLCLWPSAAPAQDDQIQRLAREILHGLQTNSIRKSREYCGLIGRKRDGTLVAGPASRGSKARCRARGLARGIEPVASFHTHGGFLSDYDNEVPSFLDLEVEMEWDLIGFVSTPGGRFWKVDGRRGEVRLICGPRCLPWDPRYSDNDGRFGKVRNRYSGEELYRRELMVIERSFQ